MLRRVAVFFLLLVPVVTGYGQEPPPAAASRFSGAGLSLYPLGWSSEGRWGALVYWDSAAGGPSFRTIVIDSVTDDVLYRSDIIPVSGIDALGSLWQKNTPFFRDLRNAFDLETNPRYRIEGLRFTEDGVTFTVTTEPPDPAGSYRLVIETSRGDKKEIFRSTAPLPEQTEILGCLMSPFEKRILVVVREHPVGDGPPAYRFVGAHLTVGFSYVPNPDGALVSAVINGQEYLTRARLADGSDADAADPRGYSLVLVAARRRHWGVMAALLDAGARPAGSDEEGLTPLHHAAAAGALTAVRSLLDAGADRKSRDERGRRPVDMAADEATRRLLR